MEIAVAPLAPLSFCRGSLSIQTLCQSIQKHFNNFDDVGSINAQLEVNRVPAGNGWSATFRNVQTEHLTAHRPRSLMLIKVDCEISLTFPNPAAVIWMLNLHPSVVPFIRVPERLEMVPPVPVTPYEDVFGNRCSRAFVPSGHMTIRNSAVVEDSGLPDAQPWGVHQNGVQDLPNEALQFLLASRYCEVDSELKEWAWGQFGSLGAGWPLVRGVSDFVHQHIHFDYQRARANRSALDVFRERVGVCRDFTHLAITLCRCLNVPSRYCTGYLGDIGVPADPAPMDFSAWFEVYLGNQWYSVDARHNVPRIGRVLVARGRDAADAALTTAFGINSLQVFRVGTTEVADPSYAKA